MVTITCSRSEMGQGVRTGIPMILADELEADWHRVSIWQAPGDETKYDPAGKDGQNTDGSRSTRHHLDVMRELGAAGRYVLEQAAAKKWGVDASEVYAKHHRLYHSASGQSIDFGEVVDAAADIAVPDRRRRPEAQGPVAVEVHRPRHAGGRQLRHEHRRRQLRCRRDHTGDEDRGGGAGARLSRQGEVVRRCRGARGPGGRAGGRDSGPARRHAGRVPRDGRCRGGRDQHLVGARRPQEARDRVGRRPERGPRLRHLRRPAPGSGPHRRPRHPRPRERRRGVRGGRQGDGGGVLRAVLHPHPDGAPGGARRRQRAAGEDHHLHPVAQRDPAVRREGARAGEDRRLVRGDASRRRVRPQVQARLRLRGGDPLEDGRSAGAGAVDPRGRDPQRLLPLPRAPTE